MDARAWTLAIICCKFLLEGGGGRALISSCQDCRVASTCLTHVSVLILLVGYLFCPQIHLRNSCTCWSSFSVEALSD